MLIVRNSSNDATFNLALEEILLKECDSDIFMLWQNKRAVIIGKNQNALEEVDENFANSNNIQIVRRLTGGGAVFHDLGNLNFTFIKRKAKQHFFNFEYFNKPILEILYNFGFDDVTSVKNDILIGGKKISGGAQTIYKDSILHHGTLLFNTDIKILSKVLKPHPLKIESKSIKSVKSRVANLSDIKQEVIDIEKFKIEAEKKMANAALSKTVNVISDQNLLAKALKLQKNKYSTWDWNFGNTFKYKINKAAYFTAGLIEVSLKVEQGKISTIKFYGDFSGMYQIEKLEKKLCNTKLERDSLCSKLKDINLNDYIKNLKTEELINIILK